MQIAEGGKVLLVLLLLSLGSEIFFWGGGEVFLQFMHTSLFEFRMLCKVGQKLTQTFSVF